MISIGLSAKGLTELEQNALKDNLRQLNAKRKRALLRDAYYDGKKRLDKYGISIPPQMRDLEVVLGWPAKACDALADRTHLNGFVRPGASAFDPDLQRIFKANQMAIEWPQALVSTFVNGAAFGFVLKGDADLGEPETLMLMMPATEATGIWNVRARRLSSAFWVSVEERKPITRAALFMPSHTVEFRREQGKPWEINRVENPLPRLGVTPLRFRPRMGRPFGMSRITRSVMALTDMAVRTLLRSDVSAEFYSSPQRYLLGADEDAFTDENGEPLPAWEAILGKMLAIPPNEDGQVPTIGQFPQMTMQPHNDQLRMIASLFCGETSLPVSSLGIIHDNPASAAAIDAAWADMVGVAEKSNRELSVPAVEMAQNALMLERGTDLTDDLVALEAKWQNPAIITQQAAADAVTKQIQVGALRPDSVVALEQMGYNQTDIERILAEHASARETDPLSGVNALLNPSNATGNSQVPPGQ